ncbi:ankyrin and het domain-containing protein [Colletotrichum kahawae]|uniref:Ankyrin and het domain-containing protein n=1 Tax=Colletotrichum kahawae TaxID=34407 RepID=A0AAD9YLQ6_COLKA|nr:ankyrin and het domain-containing protein [Colletotrichum kahawae]
MPVEFVAELPLRMAIFGNQALLNDGSLSDQTVAFIPGRWYNLSMTRLGHWYRGTEAITLVYKVKAARSFFSSSLKTICTLSVQKDYLRFAHLQLLEKHNFAVLALPRKSSSLTRWPLGIFALTRGGRAASSGIAFSGPDLRNQKVDTLPSSTVRYGRFSAGGATPGRVKVIDDKLRECAGIRPCQGRRYFLARATVPAEAQARAHPPGSTGQLACGSEGIDEMSPERLDSFWRALTCERSQLSDRIDVDMSDHLKTMIKGMEVRFNSEEEADRARARFVFSGQSVEMSVLSAATQEIFDYGRGQILYDTEEWKKE